MGLKSFLKPFKLFITGVTITAVGGALAYWNVGVGLPDIILGVGVSATAAGGLMLLFTNKK